MRFRGVSVNRCLRALALAVVLGMSMSGATLGSVGSAPAAAAAASTPTYYVAMGASLAAGVGATSSGNSYVGRVYKHESAHYPGLQLENFSCAGATTTDVINGTNCGSRIPQLATAEKFLEAHRGQVAFLTIDIGADELQPCWSKTTELISAACWSAGLQADTTNLPKILSGLKAAYPGVRVFGMNYYDPFLVAWLKGTSYYRQVAQRSVMYLDQLNSNLAQSYHAAGFPIADAAITNHNFALTGSYSGQMLPQNVADICNWTHMCVNYPDVHANDTGYAKLAGLFEPLIDAYLPCRRR